MYSQELLKGTLQIIVLSLLAEKDRMYGYEITQHVKERTEGKIQLTEGALYPDTTQTGGRRIADHREGEHRQTGAEVLSPYGEWQCAGQRQGGGVP
jgi:DNA-binding PadR family transcriptional regulator